MSSAPIPSILSLTPLDCDARHDKVTGMNNMVILTLAGLQLTNKLHNDLGTFYSISPPPSTLPAHFSMPTVHSSIRLRVFARAASSPGPVVTATNVPHAIIPPLPPSQTGATDPDHPDITYDYCQDHDCPSHAERSNPQQPEQCICIANSFETTVLQKDRYRQWTGQCDLCEGIPNYGLPTAVCSFYYAPPSPLFLLSPPPLDIIKCAPVQFNNGPPAGIH